MQKQSQDYRDLLNSKHMSDVTFVVDGEKFFAHKFILCASCKYFNNLLSGSLSDFNGLDLEIEIRDYSPLIFYRILQFIYTGTIGNLKELNDQMVLILMDAAIFYQLEHMQLIVEEYIVNNLITVPNVCVLWRIGVESGAKVVVAKCVEFFRQHVDEITQLPDFLDQISGIRFDVENVLKENQQTTDSPRGNDFNWPSNFELANLDENNNDFLLQSLLQDYSPPQYASMPNPLLNVSNLSLSSSGGTPAMPSDNLLHTPDPSPGMVTSPTGPNNTPQPPSQLQSPFTNQSYYPNSVKQEPNNLQQQQQQIQQQIQQLSFQLSHQMNQLPPKVEPTLKPSQFGSVPNTPQNFGGYPQQYPQNDMYRPTGPYNPDLNQPDNLDHFQNYPQNYNAVRNIYLMQQAQMLQQQQQQQQNDYNNMINSPRLMQQQQQQKQQQQQHNNNNNNGTPQQAEFSAPRPPPPSYKALATKQTTSSNSGRLPMLQGPVWQKALEKMNILIELMRDIAPADFGTLFLHDPITNELYSHVTHPEPVNIAMPSHLGIAGSVFTTGQIINSPSAYTDPRFYSGIDRQTGKGAPTLAILAVPIVSSEVGRPIGVLELLNKKRTTSFTAENEKEAAMIARMVARIVERSTREVKQDIEKKGTGMKRIHMYQVEENQGVKKPRSRRRNSIPVFHFKQVKPSDIKNAQQQQQQQAHPQNE